LDPEWAGHHSVGSSAERTLPTINNDATMLSYFLHAYFIIGLLCMADRKKPRETGDGGQKEGHLRERIDRTGIELPISIDVVLFYAFKSGPRCPETLLLLEGMLSRGGRCYWLYYWSNGACHWRDNSFCRRHKEKLRVGS